MFYTKKPIPDELPALEELLKSKQQDAPVLLESSDNSKISINWFFMAVKATSILLLKLFNFYTNLRKRK